METGIVTASPQLIATHLTAYGENDAALRIQTLDAHEVEMISEIAFVHACNGMKLAESLSLAAVEVCEGKPRPVKRKRRNMSVYKFRS